MEQIYSSDDFHPRDRFTYWQDVINKATCEHDAKPHNRLAFNASLQAANMGPASVSIFSIDGLDVERRSAHIARALDDDLILCRLEQGSMRLQQGGRELTLRPGDLTLVDTSRPNRSWFAPQSRCINFKLPRADLEIRTGAVERLSLRSIPNRTSMEADLATQLLLLLPDYVPGLQALNASKMHEQLCDLLASSLLRADDKIARLSSAQSTALLAIRTAIEVNVANPNVTAEVIAGSAGVSVRYANQLLSIEHTSVMRLLRDRRLHRCKVTLEDRSQDHRSVSDIAFAWGFSDASHFGRVFKAQYGVAPSDHRAMSRMRSVS